MKTLLCALLLGFGQPTIPAQPTALLQGFMRDVISQQLNDTELENKYLCPTQLQQQSVAGDKARIIVGKYLSLLRTQLNEQKVNPEEIVFTPFDSLPAKPFEIIGGSQQVYAVQYRCEDIFYFLVEENKISSFYLINQDGQAYFVTFCR